MMGSLKTLTRRVISGAAVVALASALALGGAPAASAQVYRVYHATDDISARLTPTAAPTNLKGPYRGNAINVECQVIGQPAGPHGNTLYFGVTWPGIGRIYVPDAWTDSPHLAGQPPIAGIPMCGSVTPPPTPGPPATGTYMSRASNVGFCVNTGLPGCRPAGTPVIPANIRVEMVCYADGSWANVDYNTNRWFWVKQTGTGIEGFVTASLVKRQTGVAPCGSNTSVVVAQQAASRVGQVWAQGTDATAFSKIEWGTPLYEWAGDCPKLPYVSWKAVGVTTQHRNAIDNWNTYVSRGQTHGGTPSVGATVFFRIPPIGHEAVYLGSGWIATTNGYDGDRKAITAVPMSTKPNYLGWVWGV